MEKPENIIVIAVSENEKLPIKEISSEDGILNIILETGKITFDGESVTADDGSVFNIKDAKIPEAFKWVKKNGKMVTDYGF